MLPSIQAVEAHHRSKHVSARRAEPKALYLSARAARPQVAAGDGASAVVSDSFSILGGCSSWQTRMHC
eukprot:6174844-Pleurochrysis_carterae.AAC.1